MKHVLETGVDVRRPSVATDVQTTHLMVLVDTLVNTFRIGHVLEHNLADMQSRLAKAQLQNLDVSYLSLIVAVADGEQTFGQEDLKFLDKEVFGIVDADKGADHIAWLIRPEV